MDSRTNTDPRVTANTERSTSAAPGPRTASRPILSSVGKAKFEQLAPNYSESEVATSTTNSNGRPQYYIDYNRNTSGEVKKGMDDSATQKMTETGSFYSYHSARDISTFVREIGGRMFNSTSELYMLPSDDDEFQRLAKQHYALVLAVNGLYPAPEIVEEILDPARTDRQPSILDLGCGSGIWAIEMAQKFPHASVVGIDLAPAPVDLETVPTNCRFEIDDINLGLTHYHEHFDVIHVRCIGSGVDNYEDMMLDAEACLRPGGIIIFMDGDMKMYSDDFVDTVPVGLSEAEGGDPVKGSWMHRLARETRLAGIYNGADIEGMEDGIDRGLWGHPLIEPSTIRVASLFAPLGPWAAASDPQETQKLRYSGSLIRQDFIRLGHAWHALLAKAGVPQEMLDDWAKRAADELNENRFRMSHRWRLTWGRRKFTDSPAPSRTDTPNGDAPTTPNPAYRASIDPTLSSKRIANGAQDYRSFIVYSRKEDAARAMHLRKDAAKKLPTPLVEKLRESRAQTSGNQ